jgi:hypothetical protein
MQFSFLALPTRCPVYHGDRARYHYFQCLQLILRHQVKALVGLWKLPPEFEVSSIYGGLTLTPSKCYRLFVGMYGLYI